MHLICYLFLLLFYIIILTLLYNFVNTYLYFSLFYLFINQIHYFIHGVGWHAVYLVISRRKNYNYKIYEYVREYNPTLSLVPPYSSSGGFCSTWRWSKTKSENLLLPAEKNMIWHKCSLPKSSGWPIKCIDNVTTK